MNKLLQTRIFNLIPAQYRDQCCIAGGAAAYVQKATDIDVFVLGRNLSDSDAYELERDLRKHLRSLQLKAKFRSDTEESIEDPYPDGNMVVADIPEDPFNLPIQIIAAPAMTIPELLDEFDLSTHCVAIAPDGTVHTTAHTTGISESPKLVNVRVPAITISRYRMLCLRYELYPDADQLVELCLMRDPDNGEKFSKAKAKVHHTTSKAEAQTESRFDDDIPF